MVFCMFTRGYLYSTMAFVKRLVNQPVFSQALVAVIPDGVIDVHRNICHIDPPPELWVEILIPNLFFNTKNDQSICGFVGRRQIVQPCDDLHFRHRTFDGNPKHVPSGFSSESTVSAAQSSIKGTPYGKHDVNQPISMVNICKTHSNGQNPQSSKFFPEKKSWFVKSQNKIHSNHCTIIVHYIYNN